MIVRGTVFVISGGAYSSYTIEGQLLAKENFDPEAMIERFLRVTTREYQRSGDFFRWLKQQPEVEHVPSLAEWHCIEYGEFLRPVKIGQMADGPGDEG